MSYLATYHRPSFFSDPSFSDPSFSKAFSQFFDDVAGTSKTVATKTIARFSPKVDVLESANSYKVVVDLPGFEKSDISIDIHDDELTLKAKQSDAHSKEQADDNASDEYTLLRTERTKGYFERKFSLNDSVNTEAVSAKLEKGVLEVTLPKVEEVAAKTLSVDVQ